jgi:hypothetical protein
MKQDLYIMYIDVPENNDVLNFKLLYYDQDKMFKHKKINSSATFSKPK